MRSASRPHLALPRHDALTGGTLERLRPARRISLWRLPRARSLLALGVLGVLGAVVAAFATVYTELLSFRELGREQVLWTTLRWKVLAHGLPGFGTAAFVVLNLTIAERRLGAAARLRPHRRLAYPLAAVVAGVIAAEWRSHGVWPLLALWSARGDFGTRDPLFHRDVGFFVFSLPLYQQVSRWALEAIVMTAAATVAAYFAAGALPRARAHLLVLAALALVVLAWRCRLDQFALAVPHDASVVPGASYADVHVRLPVRRVLVLVCLGGAALCVYAAARGLTRGPTLVVTAVAATAALAQSALPAAIERFDVQPQQLARERPYLADAIAATRRAFALDAVDVHELPDADRLSRLDLAANRRTVANVSLWDPAVLRPMLDDQESIGGYYRFPRLTVDRYDVDGEPRMLAVAARELDRSRLSPGARSWANDRFAYTHGYGAVAVSVGAVDRDGQARFVQREFASGPLALREPRIYYGRRPGRDPPYVIATSGRGEIDRPVPGSQAPDYHYDGAGGIQLSSTLRRLAFAARFGDLKLLLTETVTGRSRIMLDRDARDRVRTLAPFLRWDAHPQTTIVDGRVQYLLHGYTTSTHYPYSALVRMGPTRVNYARASVQATVDAFSGRVRLYAIDATDPLLRAWAAVYPDLFHPAEQMPDGVRAHLRYPKPLFKVQARAYARYHANDATAFWNGADAWQLPLQLAGPVEDAGEIQFPDPRESVERDERGDDEPAPRWHMRPAYIFARLPGRTRERLMLVTPFTPRGRENLSAYLSGWIDAGGTPRLSVLSLPRDRLVIGPTQATRRILASPAVSKRLELLNRESRDLGHGSVNRTILGDARSIPIGDTLVHVQPIYLVAGGSGMPRMQLVTVLVDGQVGYGRTLRRALRRALAP
jgi:uncharacterized protein